MYNVAKINLLNVFLGNALVTIICKKLVRIEAANFVGPLLKWLCSCIINSYVNFTAIAFPRSCEFLASGFEWK